jgi:hypothetical protein
MKILTVVSPVTNMLAAVLSREQNRHSSVPVQERDNSEVPVPEQLQETATVKNKRTRPLFMCYKSVLTYLLTELRP